MEVVVPVCECLKCLWPLLARRLSYAKHLNENVKILDNEVEKLCSRKEDINREINRDTILKIPSTECQTWLTQLEQLVKEVKEIEQEFNANRRRLHVCCFPNIFWRKKLGKRVVNMLINDITRLKGASIYMGGAVVVDAPLQIVEREPVHITEVPMIDLLVQKILTLIINGNCLRIGLWGMGGVGKTTVMKKLTHEPQLEQAFDIVIWVTVSRDWSVAGVQNQIMQRLGMDRMDNEFDGNVARKLLQTLEANKYLLLLDDVWSPVNMEDVGIPMSSAKFGSKVILATRNLLVCKQMGTDEDINVKVLSKEEAWRLFREKVGDVIDSPNIEPIARQVVEECDGLPLAVIVIGGSMRKVKEVHAWRNALEELRSASFEIGDMEDMVFKQLKFSYDRLKNDNIKNCFLYCALYPEDFQIPVDELVKHWKDEGFIQGVQRLDKAYDKACTILDGLIGDSLLERVDDNFVKMHDVIRDLALRITSPYGEGPSYFVRSGVGIQECGNTGEWEEAEKISLMRNYLSSLPASPTCNSLGTLLLQQNYHLETIPGQFFNHMHSLRLLNLWETGIRVLPPSVSNLVNLRALYLGNIESLPSEIGGLKRLEVLHIEWIVSLPIEVRELGSLRSLRVGFGRNGEEAMRRMCCDGVISCLCLLEDLRFYFPTDSLLQQWHEMVNIGGVGEEVGSLKHLTSLMFGFSTECLAQFVKKKRMMNCPEFTQFLLSVEGYIAPDLLSQKEILGKELTWRMGETEGSGMVEVVGEVLISQAFKFSLIGHKTVEKLSDFGIQNLYTLQSCRVEDCLAMESIISVTDGIGGTTILPNLQKLTLDRLPNLSSICDDPLSFMALRELWIIGCGKLRSVFTRSMIQHMPNLEKFHVLCCENMEEIVAVREAEDQVVDDVVLFFPRLKEFFLQGMNKLVRIWKGVSSQPWPSLEQVLVIGCPNLKTLNLKVMDNDHHNATSVLRKIEGKREWWEALEWEHNDDHLLQPLFKESPWEYEVVDTNELPFCFFF